MNSSRKYAVGGTILLVCAALNVALYIDELNRFEYRPAKPSPAVLLADPLNNMHALGGIPCLIAFDDRDPVVPPADNEIPTSRKLGSDCHVIMFHGTNHTDPRVLDPKLTLHFLSRFAPNSRIILLHGWGRPGSAWFRAPTGQEKDPAVMEGVRFGNAIKAKFHCETGDFAGNSWGNDEAVRDLEMVTRQAPPVILVSSSMGAALMWRFAEKYPERVAAMVGLSPVCSLRSMCSTQFGTDIVRAYKTR